MFWWIITVFCVCGALLIQYICSSKILRMKQNISLKNMALRDVRAEIQRLDKKKNYLDSQESSLTRSIRRLRTDIKGLVPRLKQKNLSVPDPDFQLAELDDGESI